MYTSPILIDVETAPLENVRAYIEPPDMLDIQAPSNYVKLEAIEAYIAREIAKRIADFEQDCTSKAALDFNTARIVAMGWWTEQNGILYRLCNSDITERHALTEFWEVAKHRTIIGFRVREFDLPMMIQRSRYLGVAYPQLDLGRYARNGVEDLYDLLTFNDLRSAEKIMPRTAKSFARRFGIPVPDDIDGSEIPALVAAGAWDKVAAHCQADVELEVALARRLGLIQSQPQEAVL